MHPRTRRIPIVAASLAAALMAVAVTGVAARQEADRAAGARQPREPETLVEQWAAALQAGRVELMKPLLADDYLYVNPRGEAIDGVTLMRLLKDRSLQFKIEPADRRLRLHKGALVVTGTCRVTGEMDGNKLDGDYRYLDVFERQGERWVAIASSLTRVQDAARPAAAPKGASAK